MTRSGIYRGRFCFSLTCAIGGRAEYDAGVRTLSSG